MRDFVTGERKGIPRICRLTNNSDFREHFSRLPLDPLLHVPCTIQSVVVRLPLCQEKTQQFNPILSKANNAAYQTQRSPSSLSSLSNSAATSQKPLCKYINMNRQYLYGKLLTQQTSCLSPTTHTPSSKSRPNPRKDHRIRPKRTQYTILIPFRSSSNTKPVPSTLPLLATLSFTSPPLFPSPSHY